MHTDYLEFLFNKDAKSIIVEFVNIFKTFDQQVENATKVIDYLRNNNLIYCSIGPECIPGKKDYYKPYRLPSPTEQQWEQDDDPYVAQYIERDDQIELVQSTVVINVTKLDEKRIKQIVNDLYNLADVEVEFE